MTTLSRSEFIGLMAFLMSLTALSIDAMLPALSFMQQELHVESENHVQFIIGIVFAGLMVGQLLFGPLADSRGRKFGISVGLVIFIIGSVISLFASSFSMMLFGRFLQGFGAAAPRVVTSAIVRDMYVGRDMAQVMSFIMTVFIFVPMVAPAIGEVIINTSGWRMIFAVYILCAIVAAVWMSLRLEETLTAENRHPFSLRSVARDFKLVLKNKTTMGYTVASGLVFSGLIGYLSSAQQVFQGFFDTGKLFALYFGVTALSIGLASLTNGMMVQRFGMHRIYTFALMGVVVSAAMFMALFDLSSSDDTTFAGYMVSTFIIFFGFGLLFGNLTALAMEPMGERAGTASAVVGALSTAIAIAGGMLIGQSFNMTLWPMMIGFFSFPLMTLIIHRRLENL